MTRILMILLMISSVLVALVSYRFFALGLALSFPDMAAHVFDRRLAFVAHITAAPVALFFGSMQFVPSLRIPHPAIHRWAGRVYVLAVLVGGGSGMLLAFGAIGGPVAGWGFGLLSVLWIATTLQAVRLAMIGRHVEHRRWMMRSFALTFAAVTLRLQLAGMVGLGSMSYASASVILAWSCWIPNLLFVEWLIARKPRFSAMATVD